MNRKKIFFLVLILSLIGCNSQKHDYSDIPAKNEISGVTIAASSVNTKNIDNYLFRDDTIYVDLRPYSWVARDGHIAGFSFYPFYDFLAHLNYDDRLFKMDGGVGTIGCFTPNYVESERILYNLFPKDKYIFAISQSGVESNYFLNLLIQYGYNASKLYNIGGFANNAGFDNVAYINIDNPRFLVKGNPLIDYNYEETFNFMSNLTPISNNI